jgi:ABC-type branched-subunit amino acid transport system substrate-binding protein
MSHQRYRTPALGVAVLAAVALAMAGCSSSSKSGGGGSSAAGGASAAASSGSGGGASGTPIKLGITVPIASVVDYGEAVSAAKGAARAINAAGGVNGHPLVIDSCNGGLDPNKETACVRKLISDKVAATVGNAIYTSEKTSDELFKKAGIAQIGNYASGISETDPNSYLFFGGQTYANAGQIYAATKWAGKKVGVVRLDFPYTAPYFDFYRKACQSLGCTVVSTAVIPSNEVTDFSTYASQLLKGNPDVIVPDLGPLILPLLKALNQLGFKGKMVMQDTNATTKAFQGQPASVQQQYIISSPFPPPSTADKFPGIKQFLKDMEAEKASGDSLAPTYTTYSQTATMDAYIAVYAFKEIASQAKAYDAGSFKKAIDSAKDVDLLGLTKPWTPSQVLDPKLPRASLDSWYFYKIVDGAPSLLQSETVAVTDIVKAGGQ